MEQKNGNTKESFMNKSKFEIFEQFNAIEDIFSESQWEAKLYSPTPDDKHENRYIDILPYADNKVEAKGKYFNGSPIRLLSNTVANIVASQAPKQPFITFWNVIIERHITLVVMLCAFVDPNRGQQAQKYWPPDGKTLLYDDISVTSILLESHLKDVEFREITIKQNNQQHKLTHIHWFGWEDFGVPSKKAFDTMYFIVQEMIKNISQKKQTLVHCSAGVGRTGTILAAIDALTFARKGQFNKLSVKQIVTNLRQQRYGSVQRDKQYQHIYEFVRECIRRSQPQLKKQQSDMQTPPKNKQQL